MLKPEKAMKAAGVAFFLLLFCFYTTVRTETDVDSVKKIAEQGDASTQFNLDLMFANGWGVPKTTLRL